MPAGMEAGLDRGSADALRRLLAWVRPQAPLLALALMLGLAASAADVARAFLIKPVVDDVVLPHGSLVAPSTLARWLPDAAGGAEVAAEAAPAPGRTGPPSGGERRGLDDAGREALTHRIEANLVRVVLLFAALALLLPLLELLRDYATAFSSYPSHWPTTAMRAAATW
jgi:ABC-type multidrug transport system fused ATPase/permease subunit